jgi:hypothetical protein
VTGDPEIHFPAAQKSPTVHGFPSSQIAELKTKEHFPVSGSQWLSVHGLESSHVFRGPGIQLPSLQTSLRVQAFPSVQEEVVGTEKQVPLSGSQESRVQSLPSEQLKKLGERKSKFFKFLKYEKIN